MRPWAITTVETQLLQPTASWAIDKYVSAIATMPDRPPPVRTGSNIPYFAGATSFKLCKGPRFGTTANSPHNEATSNNRAAQVQEGV